MLCGTKKLACGRGMSTTYNGFVDAALYSGRERAQEQADLYRQVHGLLQL